MSIVDLEDDTVVLSEDVGTVITITMCDSLPLRCKHVTAA